MWTNKDGRHNLMKAVLLFAQTCRQTRQFECELHFHFAGEPNIGRRRSDPKDELEPSTNDGNLQRCFAVDDRRVITSADF